MSLDTQQQELWNTLTNGASVDFWWDPQTLQDVMAFQIDVRAWGELKSHAKRQGINPFEWQKAVDAGGMATNGNPSRAILPSHETGTQLLQATIPIPAQFFDGLLHEGMLLFGGKSKRGKSWLAFDMAMSLAIGRAAFRHFPNIVKAPVLYLALEDGRARLQGRMRQIQANIQTLDDLHLRYIFPLLADGAIDILGELIEQYHYGLIVVDVLARLEGAGKRGEKNYLEVYDMFAPIQELRKKLPFCFMMLTHLRKSEAEDVFDNIMGSTAYQGAQDVLWVLERKPKDDFAFLHVRDKDTEDKTIALRFIDGHWEYMGEGEEYALGRDQRRIIQILTEEHREVSIQEIMMAGGFPDAKYAYIRNMLVSMVKDDLIHRARHGKYSSTIRGELEYGPMKDDEDGEGYKF